MTKHEIFELSNNQKSYDLLFDLIKSSKNPEEVFYAWLKQAVILYEYEEYERSSEILKKLFTEKDFLEDKYLAILIDSLIKIENKADALYYLNIRKESLSQIDMYLYYLDLLKYKDTFNEDFYPLLDSLRAYSFDRKVLRPYYIKMLEDYLKNNKEDALEIYEQTINLNLEEHDKEYVLELYFEYLIKNDLDYETFLKNNKEIAYTYYNLRLLMRKNELKKVQILEAENEVALDDLSLFRKKILFKELKDFYEGHRDLKSYDLYFNKFKYAEEEYKKENKPKRKRKLVIKEEKTLIKEIVIPEKKKEKPTITGEKLMKIEQFMYELLTLDFNLSFFERLRRSLIIMNKHFEFSDVLIYQKPNFFHFKKERLYEKNFQQSTIDSSIIGIASNNAEDIVGYVEYIDPNYDLITSQELTKTIVKQVYCYGLLNGFSICFYQTNKRDLHYDDLVFKVLSNILSYDLKNEQHIKTYKSEFDYINNLFNSNFLISFIYKDEFVGSPLFNSLFNLKKNDSLDALILKFQPEHRVRYNSMLNRLKKEEIKSFEIDLVYEEKNYLVKHYINDGYVYGIFVEVTKRVEELTSWQEKAFVDPLSNLLTLHEFEVAFESYRREKTTFVLIELSGLNKIEFLYGKALKRQYFLEFVEFCKTDFEYLYLFDPNSVIGVLNVNDIRTIENKLSLFTAKIKEFQSKILAEQSFEAYMGVIRYPINTRERNIERIYQYLSLSLNKAKTIEKNKRYSYFDFKDYEQDLFETQLIKQIDNLIIKEELMLLFTQIVNQKSKRVYAYEVGVTSEVLNVYQRYYYQVAEKRGMLEKLERYVLTQAFKDLKKIYDETGFYIKLVINVSQETLNNANFTAFLINLYKTYKIPYETVELKVNLNRYTYEQMVKLQELSMYGVIIGVDNLEYINRDFVEVIHLTKKQDLEKKKTKAYLKNLNEFVESEEMNLIIYNVDAKEEQEILKELNINHIRGKMVDRELTLSQIMQLLKGN